MSESARSNLIPVDVGRLGRVRLLLLLYGGGRYVALLLGLSGLIHSHCSEDKTASAMPVSGPLWLQLAMANVVQIC